MEEILKMEEQVSDPASAVEETNEALSIEFENVKLKSKVEELRNELERVRKDCDKFQNWWQEDYNKLQDIKKALVAIVRAKDISAEDIVKILF